MAASDACILQFGTGVLVRGLVDWMLQRAKDQSLWSGSVLGIKLTPQGPFPLADSTSHPHITRGFLAGEAVEEKSTLDVVRAWLNPYDPKGMAEFLESASSPKMKIVVSNSTEAGLIYTETPKPAAGECPESFPAKLLMWLHARFVFDANLDATVLPLELIEDNGPMLKDIVRRHAEDWNLGADFAAWLQDKCNFPSTLVDRIVTKPGKDDDPLTTISEPYHLLVLQGADSLEEQWALRKAGCNVIYTTDLASYRTRKVRVLNGAHHTITFLGIAMGKGNVLECIDDPVLGKFLSNVLAAEILPILAGEKEELAKYAEAIVERFRNPWLDHRLDAIAMNSAAKVQVRLIPSIADNISRTGAPPAGLVLALAAFCAYEGSAPGCSSAPVLEACKAVPGLEEALNTAILQIGNVGAEEAMRGTGRD